MRSSFILGEEQGLFKWAIKFYLDGIDGEVLLAQFYFGGIIVLAQFYYKQGGP
jgi:hypothetical protein